MPPRTDPPALPPPAETLSLPEGNLSRWFAEEVRPHSGDLRSYLQRAFPGVRDVDDVVQDSLLRIWTVRAVRHIGCARSFLFKVARHRAIDLLRTNRASPLVAVRDLAALPVVEEKADPAHALTTREKIIGGGGGRRAA